MFKTYKFALRPTTEQAQKIKHNLECVNKLRKLYIQDMLDGKRTSNVAVKLIEHYSAVDPSIIEGSDYGALLCELLNIIEKQDLNPNKKLRGYSTRLSNYLKSFYPERNGKVFVPKVGYVKYIRHIEIPKNANVIKYHIEIDSTNKYFISFVVEEDKQIPKQKEIKSIIGLDYSARHLIVDSEGRKYTPLTPRHIENEKKIAQLQKQREMCQKGSRQFKSYTLRINKIYKSEANFRKDYLHKLSRSLADKYDCVVIENLSMKQIASAHGFGKNTMNNSYYKFVNMLEYKLQEQGKKLIKIEKYFPSTRTCSVCKRIKPKIELSEKTWTCPHCGTFHDRDINAAINIKEEGKRIANLTLG